MATTDKTNIGVDSRADASGARLRVATLEEVGIQSPEDVLLRVAGLRMHFPIMRGVLFQRQVGAVRAVDGLDFFVKKGETLGLVGESGCGKSTAGRAILQLYNPTAGKVGFKGENIVELP